MAGHAFLTKHELQIHFQQKTDFFVSFIKIFHVYFVVEDVKVKNK